MHRTKYSANNCLLFSGVTELTGRCKKYIAIGSHAVSCLNHRSVYTDAKQTPKQILFISSRKVTYPIRNWSMISLAYRRVWDGGGIRPALMCVSQSIKKSRVSVAVGQKMIEEVNATEYHKYAHASEFIFVAVPISISVKETSTSFSSH